VQAANRNVHAAGTVSVGNRIRAPGGRDVCLDDDQVRLIVERHLLDVLVPDRHVVILVEEPGQGRKPQRGKERILDGAEKRTRGLGQGGENHLYPHEQPTS